VRNAIANPAHARRPILFQLYLCDAAAEDWALMTIANNLVQPQSLIGEFTKRRVVVIRHRRSFSVLPDWAFCVTDRYLSAPCSRSLTTVGEVGLP